MNARRLLHPSRPAALAAALTLALLAGALGPLLGAIPAVHATSITLVRRAQTTNPGSGLTVSATLPSVGAGDMLLVSVATKSSSSSYPAATVSSISDGVNTYISAASNENGISNYDTNVELWYAPHVAASGGNRTVTVTLSGNASTTYSGIIVSEYSGLASIAPIDVTATANATSSSTSAAIGPSAATAWTSDLVVGAAATDAYNYSSVASAQVNYSNGTSRSFALLQQDATTATTGTQTATMPFSTTGGYTASGHWAGVLVAFKNADAPIPPGATIDAVTTAVHNISSIYLTPNVAPSVGDLLLVMVSTFASTGTPNAMYASTVSDGVNTYTEVDATHGTCDVSNCYSNGVRRFQYFYHVATDTTNRQVAVTYTGASYQTYQHVAVMTYRGPFATSGTLDAVNEGYSSSSANPISLPTITTSNATDLVVGGMDNSSVPVFSAVSPFTLDATAIYPSYDQGVSESLSVSSVGSYTPQFSRSGSGLSWAGITAAFKIQSVPNSPNGGVPLSVPAYPNLTQTTAVFSWTASAGTPAASGYHIYNNGTLVGSGQGGGDITTTSATITGLTAGTPYTNWTIKAYNAAGESTSVAIPNFTTLTYTPNPPSALTTPTTTSSSMSFSWTVPGGPQAVDGYHVYNASHVQQGSDLTPGSTTSATIVSLSPHTQYTGWTIVAYNSYGESTSVASIPAFTTLYSTPSAPALSAASDTGSSSSDRLTNLINGLVFTGTADPNTNINLWYGGSTWIGSATSDGSGNYSVTTSVAIPANATSTITANEGAGLPTARQYTQAGNISAQTLNTLSPGFGSATLAGDTLVAVVSESWAYGIYAPTAPAGWSPVTSTNSGNTAAWLYIYPNAPSMTSTGNWTTTISTAWSVSVGEYTNTTVYSGATYAGSTSNYTPTLSLTNSYGGPAVFVGGIAYGAGDPAGVTSSGSMRLREQFLNPIGTAHYGSSAFFDLVSADGSANIAATGVMNGYPYWTAIGLVLAPATAGPSSGSTTVTTDTTAPAAPSVTGSGTSVYQSAANGKLTAETSVVGSLALSAATSDTSGIWYVNYGAATPPAGWTYVSGNGAGSGPWTSGASWGAGAATTDWTLPVTAYDAAGNTSSTTLTLAGDVSPPVVTVTTPAGNVAQNTGSITLAWTETDVGSGINAATRSVQRQQTTFVTPDVCDTTWSNDGVATATATPRTDTGLSDGCYRYILTLADNLAHSASTTSPTVSVDVSAPSAPSAPALAPASDTGISSTDRLTSLVNGLVFTGTAEAGSTVNLYGGATLLGSATATAGGAYTVTTTVTLSANTATTITATATDAAANTSVASAGTSVTTDTIAPVNTVTAATTPTHTTPLTFTAAFSEPVYGLTAGGLTIAGTAGATTGVVSGAGTTWTISVNGMTGDGTVTAAVNAGAATDAAGNPTAASAVIPAARQAIATGYGTSTITSTSTSPSFSSATLAGDTLVAIFARSSAWVPPSALTSIPDGWQLVASSTATATAGVWMYVYPNAPSMTATGTWSWSGASGYSMLLAEYSGVDGTTRTVSGPFNGTVAIPVVGPLANPYSGSALYIVGIGNYLSSTSPLTATAPFTMRTQMNNSWSGNGYANAQFLDYVSNTASAMATESSTGGSNGWDAVGVVFAPGSGTASTTYDTTAPTSTASALSTYQTTRTFSVPYTATDTNGSGVASVNLYVATDPGTALASYTLVGNYTSSPISYTAPADGPRYFYTLATDNAGNTQSLPGTYQASTTVDTVAPAGTLVINGGATRTTASSVTLTFSATDVTSGLYQMQFSNDGSNWSTLQAYATSASWTLAAGAGAKTVYVRWSDNAGNLSTAVTATISYAPPGTAVGVAATTAVSAQSSIALGAGVAPSVGDLLLVIASNLDNGGTPPYVSSVSDGLNPAYTEVDATHGICDNGQTGTCNSSSLRRVQYFYTVATSTSIPTITLTYTGSVSGVYEHVAFIVYQGPFASSGTLDVKGESYSSTSSSTISLPAITTTNAADLVVGGMTGSSTPVFVAGTSPNYTLDATAKYSGQGQGVSESLVAASIDTYTPKFTFAGPGQSWAGISAAFKFQSVPNPPTSVALMSVTATSVTFAWTPSVGLPTPDGYRVRDASNNLQGSITPSTATGLTVSTGLTANTAYSGWYVDAYTTANGEGVHSIIPTFTTLPNAPTSPTVGTIGATTMGLSWTAGAGGAAADTYTVYTSGASAVTGCTAVTTTSCTATSGLSANTAYSSWYVAAANAGGSSANSSAFANFTTLPGAPTSPTVGTLTTTTAALSWTAGAGGGALTSAYTVFTSGGTALAGCTAVGTTSCTATGLTANTVYAGTYVTAATTAGTSAQTTFATITTLPTAPISPTLGTLGATTMGLSWTAGAGGAAADTYTVYNSSAQVALGCAAVGTTSCTATGLSGNTAYSGWYVVATNAGGNSVNSSAFATFTTLFDVPTSFAFTGTTVGTLPATATASFSWIKGTGSVDGFRVYNGSGVQQGPDITPGTATTATITGLLSNTNYTGWYVTQFWSSTNSTASNTVSFTTASVAPSSPILSTASDTGSSSTDSLTNLTSNLVFTGTADPNMAVTLWNGATQIGSGTASALGAYSITTTVAIPVNATSTITARAGTAQGQIAYTVPGTYTFTVPTGVTSLDLVSVGAGGSASSAAYMGAGGGALTYANNIAVTQGQQITVVVGAATWAAAGGQSSFGGNFIAGGGGAAAVSGAVAGGTGSASSCTNSATVTPGSCNYQTFAGGAGGSPSGTYSNGGGGAGGYSAAGGSGNTTATGNGVAGSGGSGGGGAGEGNLNHWAAGGGGGVGLFGAGAAGAAGIYTAGGGGGGSGGGNGTGGIQTTTCTAGYANGGGYGGGAGATSAGCNGSINSGFGASGAVRVIWGSGRAYPATLTADQTTTTVSISTGTTVATDTTPPTSAAGSLPASETSATFSVPYTASDTNSLWKIELWASTTSATSGYASASTTVSSATSGTISYTASGAGTVWFYTRAYDLAGNEEAAPGTADTTTSVAPAPPAPSAPILAAASDTGSSSSDRLTNLVTGLVFTGTGAVPGYAVQLYVGGSTPIGSALAAVDGSYTVTTTSPLPANTTSTITATATNGSGEGPASPGTDVTTDTTAPTSLVTAPLPATTSTAAVSVPYTSADTSGSGVASVALYESTSATPTAAYTQVATSSNANGTFTYTTPFNATYYFYTVATDVAGNVEAAPAAEASTVVSAVGALDASTPVLDPLSDTGQDHSDGLTAQDTNLVFTGTAAPGSTVTLYDGATTLGTTIAAGNGAWSLTVAATLDAGTHSLTATETLGGNTSPPSAPATVIIDTSATNSSVTTLISPQTSVTFNVPYAAFDAHGVWKIELWASTTSATSDYTLVSTTVSSCNTACHISYTALGAGTVWFYTRAYDVAGNYEAAPGTDDASTDVILVPPAPSAPALAAVSDTGSSSSDGLTKLTTALVFTGTWVDTGNLVQIYAGTTLLGSATADENGDYTVTTSVALPANTTSTITATATNGFGEGPASDGTDVTTDTLAPTFGSGPTLAPASDTGTPGDNLTTATTPAITGSTEATDALTLWDGATQVGSGTAAGDGTFSLTSGPLSVATHTLTIQVTDAAGNVGTSAPLVLTIVTPAASSIVLAPTGTQSVVSGSTLAFSAIVYDASAAALAPQPTLTWSITQGPGSVDSSGLFTAGLVGTTIVRATDTADALHADSGLITTTTGTLATITVTPNPTNVTYGATQIFTATGADAVGNPVAVTPGWSVLPGTGTGSIATDGTLTATGVGDITVRATSGAISGDAAVTVTPATLTITADDASKTYGAANPTFTYTPSGFVHGDTAAVLAGTPSLTTTATTASPVTTYTITAAAGTLTAVNYTLALVPGTLSVTPATLTVTAPDAARVTGAANPTFTPTYTGWVNGETSSVLTTPATCSTLADTASPAGTYTITCAGATAPNYTSVYAPGTLTVTPSALSAPVLAPASDTGISNSDNLTNLTNGLVFTGTAPAGSTIKLYVASTTQIGVGTTDISGNYSVTTTVAIPANATSAITATATVGTLTSDPSPALAVTTDTTAPVIGGSDGPFLAAASDSGTPGDNLTNVTSPTLTGVGAGANLPVHLYVDGNLSATGSSNGSNAWSLTTGTALAEGMRLLTFRTEDAAGNLSAASAPLYLTIDTTAPTGLTLSINGGASSTLDPAVTLTLAANGSPAAMRFANDGGAWSTWTAYDTTAAWTLPGSDGDHTVAFVARDAAGNVATPVTATIHLALAVPLAPTGLALAAGSDTGRSSSDNITNVNHPAVTGSAGNSLTVKVYSDGTLKGTTTSDASTGAWTVTLATLADGAHVLTATATNSYGATGDASTGLSVTIDTVAPSTPSAPDLAAVSDTGASSSDNITNLVNGLVFTGNAEPSGLVSVYGGSTPLGTGVANGGTGAYSVATNVAIPTNATTALTVTVTDIAGNVSSASGATNVTTQVAIPPTPSTPVLAPGSDSGPSSSDGITNITTPAISGTAVAGSTVRIFVDGALAASTTADIGGDWSLTMPALAAGTRNVTAKDEDIAGNRSLASGTLPLVIDTTAPAAPTAPVLAAASDTGVSNSDDLTSLVNGLVFTGTTEPNALVTLFYSSTALGSATADISGNYIVTTGVAIPANAASAITATATDVAGNTSLASAPTTVTTDTTSPTAPSAPALAAASDTGVSSSDNITNLTAVTLTGTAPVGSTVTLTVRGTVWGTTTANGSGVYALPGTLLANAVSDATATATDAAGNTSAASASRNLTVDTTAPVSTVGALPPTENASPFGLPYTAADNLSGVTVTSFYIATTSAGPYTFAGAASTSPFSYGPPADGTYYFYTQAHDVAGNVEAAPATYDATTTAVATAPPTTYASNWTFVGGAAHFGGVTIITDPTSPDSDHKVAVLTAGSSISDAVPVHPGDTITAAGSWRLEGHWVKLQLCFIGGTCTGTASMGDLSGVHAYSLPWVGFSLSSVVPPNMDWAYLIWSVGSDSYLEGITWSTSAVTADSGPAVNCYEQSQQEGQVSGCLATPFTPTTTTATVDAMIELDNVPATIDYGHGVPYATLTPAPPTLMVTTNSLDGYALSTTFTNLAATDTTTPPELSDGIGANTIAWGINAAPSATFVADTLTPLVTQAYRSNEAGDSYTFNSTLTVPFVNSGAYNGTATFVASTL